jgi:hypothetical protein
MDLDEDGQMVGIELLIEHPTDKALDMPLPDPPK